MTVRIATALLVILARAATVRAGSFVTFESGQVRPLALSPDGNRLFAVNTPDSQLSQTLRGLATQGAMHWRGDRTGGNQPGVDPRDERAAFLQFAAGFPDLLGRDAPLPESQMESFADFVLALTPPPNPVRALDDSLTPVQEQGHSLFSGCRDSCHTIDPAQGFFGTDGFIGITGTNPTQFMKIAHLDTFYEKVGMFVMPPPFNLGDTTFTGDQVRGFGFIHDGSVGFYNGNPEIEQYLLAFENRLAPIVGQQVTLDATSAADTLARADLLIARADAGECDLIVKGVLAGEPRGWYRAADVAMHGDRAGDAPVTDAALRAQATVAGQQRTYTCVPPGSGFRAGVDRDEDGFLDRDEIDLAADPGDAASVPFTCAGSGVVGRGRVKLTRDAAGSEEFVLRGEATLGAPIDPVGGGLRVNVTDRRGLRQAAGTSSTRSRGGASTAPARASGSPPPGTRRALPGRASAIARARSRGASPSR